VPDLIRRTGPIDRPPGWRRGRRRARRGSRCLHRIGGCAPASWGRPPSGGCHGIRRRGKPGVPSGRPTAARRTACR